MISRISRIFFATVAMVGVSTALFAQEQKLNTTDAAQPTKTVQSKEVEGTVSGMSNSFIAVLYGRSEQGIAQEMAFQLTNKVNILHKNSLKDISVGDTVKVIYEETAERKVDGSLSYKRAVKQIVFLREAPKQIKVDQELKSKPEEPVQPEESQEPISLKGLKGD
jgi:hypothetical protein